MSSHAALRCTSGLLKMLLLLSCTGDRSPIAPVAGTLALEPDGVRLPWVGDSIVFSVVLRDRTGAPLDGLPLSWSSSDTTIVRVSEGGMARAVGYGSAAIRVASGSLSAEAAVDVGERGARTWAVSREAAFTDDHLVSVWAVSDRSVYVGAGGEGGIVYHSDGARWSPMATGLRTVGAIWAADDRNVFAVDTRYSPEARRRIAHFDGTRWAGAGPTSMSGGGEWALTAVAGSSSSNVFAVGSGGLILHHDGSRWSTMESGSALRLESVWAVAEKEAFAVASTGSIRYDGTRWLPSGGPRDLQTLWGTASHGVYAGGSGIVRHEGTAGGSWTPVLPHEWERCTTIRQIWGRSSQDIYALGWRYNPLRACVLRFNGVSWSELPAPPLVENARALGGGESSLFLVGEQGLILRWNGSEWDVQNWGPTLTGVTGAASTGVIALGDLAGTLQFDGARWGASGTGRGSAPPVISLARTSTGNSFAYTRLGVHRYDGITWRDPESPPGCPYSAYMGEVTGALWADDNGALFLACSIDYWPGSWGTPYQFRQIWRLADGTWTRPWPGEEATNPSRRRFYGLWGRSGSDVFAVGENGLILRCAQESCSAMASGTGHTLRAVGGGPRGAVFTVGDAGTILRYEENSWTYMASGTTADLYAVWASSESNVYAAGTGGTLLRFDGRRWAPISSGTTEPLRAIWGRSAEEVYVVGDRGVILRGR